MKGTGKNIKWLHSQLPEWVSSGIVPPESAGRLRAVYPAPDGRMGQRLIFPILAAFGSLLIGGGIILLFAYNWDGLSRSVRTVLSFLPLVITQALAVWVYLRNQHSAAWREGIGGMLGLSVVAAIALIGQTYHIPGNLSGLLLTWAILLLPVAYLLRSKVAFMIYLSVIVGWTVSVIDGRGESVALLGFWLLLCAVLPLLAFFLKSAEAGGLKLVTAVALLVGTAFAFQPLPELLPQGWIVFFGFFFSLMFLLDRDPDAAPASVGRMPFRMIGGMGVFIFSLSLSFDTNWYFVRGWGGGGSFSLWGITGFTGNLSLLVIFALPAVIAISLLAFRWSSLGSADRVTGSSGIYITCVYILSLLTADAGMYSAVLMSLYVAAMGLTAILAGLRAGRIGTLNWGLLVFSALLLARFFDGNVGIIPRALAFIAIGTSFLIVNGLLSRRLGKAKTAAPGEEPEAPLPETGKDAGSARSEFPFAHAAEKFIQRLPNIGRKQGVALLFIVFAVQLAVPLSIIGERELVLTRGESFKFEVRPVDPYDPFRGRYVALDYPPYSLPRSSLDFEPEPMAVVFARFEADENGFARLVGITQSPPEGGAYLKTEILPHWGRADREGSVAVRIPFDRYYMNERKAPEAERLVAGRQSLPEANYIRVRIRNGNGVVEGLYVEGRPAETVLMER